LYIIASFPSSTLTRATPFKEEGRRKEEEVGCGLPPFPFGHKPPLLRGTEFGRGTSLSVPENIFRLPSF
jgi:hypothetical protein